MERILCCGNGILVTEGGAVERQHSLECWEGGFAHFQGSEDFIDERTLQDEDPSDQCALSEPLLISIHRLKIPDHLSCKVFPAEEKNTPQECLPAAGM
jgi:hypothetical protein